MAWTQVGEDDANWTAAQSEQHDIFDALIFDTLTFDATAEAWLRTGDGVGDWARAD